MKLLKPLMLAGGTFLALAGSVSAWEQDGAPFALEGADARMPAWAWHVAERGDMASTAYDRWLACEGWDGNWMTRSQPVLDMNAAHNPDFTWKKGWTSHDIPRPIWWGVNPGDRVLFPVCDPTEAEARAAARTPVTAADLDGVVGSFQEYIDNLERDLREAIGSGDAANTASIDAVDDRVGALGADLLRVMRDVKALQDAEATPFDRDLAANIANITINNAIEAGRISALDEVAVKAIFAELIAELPDHSATIAAIQDRLDDELGQFQSDLAALTEQVNENTARLNEHGEAITGLTTGLAEVTATANAALTEAEAKELVEAEVARQLAELTAEESVDTGDTVTVDVTVINDIAAQAMAVIRDADGPIDLEGAVTDMVAAATEDAKRQIAAAAQSAKDEAVTVINSTRDAGVVAVEAREDEAVAAVAAREGEAVAAAQEAGVTQVELVKAEGGAVLAAIEAANARNDEAADAADSELAERVANLEGQVSVLRDRDNCNTCCTVPACVHTDADEGSDASATGSGPTAQAAALPGSNILMAKWGAYPAWQWLVAGLVLAMLGTLLIAAFRKRRPAQSNQQAPVVQAQPQLSRDDITAAVAAGLIQSQPQQPPQVVYAQPAAALAGAALPQGNAEQRIGRLESIAVTVEPGPVSTLKGQLNGGSDGNTFTADLTLTSRVDGLQRTHQVEVQKVGNTQFRFTRGVNGINDACNIAGLQSKLNDAAKRVGGLA